jgi:glycosyltransferase involved in cell wall biosynthesis
MRIAHLINNLMGGGAQNFLVSLSISQAMAGNSVTLIVIDNVNNNEYSSNQQNKITHNGVHIVYLNRKVGSKISYIFTLIRFAIHIKNADYQILNTHLTMPHIYGGFINLFFKSFKHVITIHSSPEPWNIINNLLNSNKPIVFCSKASFNMKVQNNPINRIIDHGIIINTVGETCSDIKTELSLPEETFLVILVGALRPEKNYRLLIEISKKIIPKNIHFLICGSFNGKAQVDLTSNDRSCLHFLGLRSDVDQLLKQCDLFMSCSLREGLPISLLEALSSGIPCLLSPIIQHKDVAEGIEECYFPEKFNESGFISILYKLAERGTVDKIRILKKRKHFIEKYDIKNVTKNYTQFYKQILQ